MDASEAPDPSPAPTRRETLGWIAGAGLALGGCASSPRAARPDWPALERSLGGSVTPREDAAYEGARRALVWNGRTPERFPAALVRVADEADVRTAVRFARAHGLRVAVRGRGHGWWGAPLREGALVLDLGDMTEARVDAERRTLAAGPALTGRELAATLEPHGLAFPVGHCADVPLSGFLLAGGFGWNAGAWGPACASVRAVDVVDARGETLRADAEREPELFWAARGAGAGFPGVVVRYHLDLHPLPRAIRAAAAVYPIERLPAVAAWLPELAAGLPREVELNCIVPPPGADGARAVVLAAVAFADDDGAARTWLAPLERGPGGRLALDGPRPVRFPELFDGLEPFFPRGLRYGADVLWTRAPAGDVLQRLAAAVGRAPSPRTFGLLVPVPAPPADAPPPPDMAFGLAAPTFVGLYGVWERADDDAANRDWLDATRADLSAGVVGHYVGESDLSAAPGRARASFTPEAWERLAALRRSVDPDGLFAGFPQPGEIV